MSTGNELAAPIAAPAEGRRFKFTPEAASYLGLSATTLEKQRCTGTGPAFIRVGSRRVAYLVADLDAWVESRRRTSTSDDADERPGR